jgi:putative phosphoesterase
MKIGVISDTHGFLDPRIPKLFAGVDHILHGGDVGATTVLLELENIAPVTAVLGNVDLGMTLKLTEVVELSSKKFLLHHIVEPRNPGNELNESLTRARPDVVVFGHTHKPFCETIGNVLFLNPGYAGRQRFDLPRTAALLFIESGQMRVDYKPL